MKKEKYEKLEGDSVNGRESVCEKERDRGRGKAREMEKESKERQWDAMRIESENGSILDANVECALRDGTS